MVSLAANHSAKQNYEQHINLIRTKSHVPVRDAIESLVYRGF